MIRKLWTAILAAALGLFVFSGPAGAAMALFDQGHGQRFAIDAEGPLHLNRLAEVFRQEGAEVRATQAPITPETLADADALISSGPFRPFSPAEIEALTDFIDRGGRFVLLLHIAPPAKGILHRLGVDFSNGVVRERENIIEGNPRDFFVDDLAAHPVADGLKRFALYGAWALRVFEGEAAPLAHTSPRAWIDLNGDEQLGDDDAVQAFTVAVHGKRGRGAFLLFADDAVFQNRFLHGENLLLAKNLARWSLHSAEIDEPH